MVKDVTRHIEPAVQRELWARAAGRCQFRGCNRLLYKSPVTQERVNLAEKAHIYSFAEYGPRGHGRLSGKALNDISNLLLACHDCHLKIDRDKRGRYSATRLHGWKTEHETRIRIVTGIRSTNKSHVILYGGKIGAEDSPLHYEIAVEAMFPKWYPAEETALEMAMRSEHDDSEELFWQAEAAHLRKAFERQIMPRIKEARPNHFSIFARANQPLLMLLGALLTDKVRAEVYQLHREPAGWKWKKNGANRTFRVIPPARIQGDPALIISLSATIEPGRITSVLGPDVSIWNLTVDGGHNDFLKCREDLSAFRETARRLMVDISSKHGQKRPLRIFPAMPVACAVEFGRIRMPKAEMPWIIFDQNSKLGNFVHALNIGDHDE